MQYTFILEGLNCPNCAARIEADIKKLPQVRDVTLNLMQQKLTLEASEDPHTTLETIVHRYEPHVQVLPQDRELPPSQNHKIKPMLLRMGIGALVFLAGLLLGLHGTVSRSLQLAVYVAAYGILGYDVVLRAIKNILRGRVFDENFLMSLSSMGAFFIGEYPEAVAVMLFYQVGEFFQGLAVQRSRRSIAELMDIRPDTARVKRSGGTVTVDPRDVCVGEWILVKPGEKIPLDGVVLTGDSLVDTRALTGESVPRSVHPMDTVLSGCINETGLLTIQVTKPYGQSTVARILQMAETAAARKAPTEQFITTFARYYTPGVVVLAALLAVIPPLCFAAPWTEWIRRAFVFLVVSCPCALVLSVPLTFFGGIGAASRHGVLVKGGNFLEALNKVDTVIFDKTGTLTQGTFRVDSVLPAQGVDREQVLQAAARAEHFSNHPIARSVLAEVGPLPPVQLTDFAQLPGQGVRIRAAGKLILAGNPRLMQAHSIPYTPCDLVGTQVYVAENGRYLGCILIRDQLKPDSKSAIAALKAMGVRKTVMLTGDDKVIADHVARELGLDESYAQLLPDGKVQRLEALDAAKAPGRKLAFLGDGINDAPVLARADIGIAMGGLGSDAAIEAADVVLMTDEPSKLLEAMTVAAATHRIVVQNIVFSLAVKGAFLVLGALGMVGMWLAVFADVGVALIAVGNAMRILKH